MNKTKYKVKIDKIHLMNILDSIKKCSSKACISFDNNVEFWFYDDKDILHKINVKYESYDYKSRENTTRILIDPHLLYTKIENLNNINKYVCLSIKYKIKRGIKHDENIKISIICQNK